MLIYIEGNIGTGKTTFLNMLRYYINEFEKINYDARIVLEPVDEWVKTKDSDGKNILEKFYDNQNKYSYIFQMNSFISRIKRIHDELDKKDNKPIPQISNSVNESSHQDSLPVSNEPDNSYQEYDTSDDEMPELIEDSTNVSSIPATASSTIGRNDISDNSENESDSDSESNSDSDDDGLMEKLLFVERSIYTDKHCFAENCYETGKMSKLEYDVYCRWNNWLSDEFNVRPDAYIYLRCFPNVNYDRIQKRNRSGEEGIPIEYLEMLHNKHEKWMAQEKRTIPILTIDALQNFKDPEVMKKIVEDIYYFVKE